MDILMSRKGDNNDLSAIQYSKQFIFEFIILSLHQDINYLDIMLAIAMLIHGTYISILKYLS